MDELKERLKKVIIQELHLDGVAPESISDSAPLFGGGLSLDSLDALQLAVAVEEHFGVRVADESEGKAAFASVDALASYITARQKSAGKSP
ncbi:MAG: acyl carrier protein [Deltaproteobacteria bacterium]|nr:acyl carrier protein [Deltaproteobacteria bacterium]